MGCKWPRCASMPASSRSGIAGISRPSRRRRRAMTRSAIGWPPTGLGMTRREKCYTITFMTFQPSEHDHAHCTDELLTRAEKLCARRGARLTEQRRDVLASVARNHAAVGAYEI